MTNSAQKISEKVTIINELGLHARVAAKIAKSAIQAQASVWLELVYENGQRSERANASQILEVMTLACPKGSEIVLTIDDPADMKILEDIVRMVKEGFGE